MPPAAIDATDDPDLSQGGAAIASSAVDAPAPSDGATLPQMSAPRATQAPVPAALPFSVPTPAPMASHGDIRGVLIQVAGARLLLPNATIAEVLSYADPEPAGADAPAWLLGLLRWRGWQVPLVAFGTLAGVAEERAVLGSKVVVLKALAGTSRTPYFAMLTQGFPRLVTVSRQALSVEDDDAGSMPRGVQARVRLNEDPALLPDLEVIEALVAEAVAQAA
jgi:chemosensory pili system protein ChpC